VISRVVIHTIANASMDAIVNRTATVLGRGTSSHYYVFRNGCIIQMVREANVAFHVGAFNGDSIGIEHADICNDPAPYTTQLYERSAELVREILTRNGLPLRVFGIHTNVRNNATVIGHGDRVPGHHGDPGAYWDWEYYARLLQWNGQAANQRPIRLVATAAQSAAAPTSWEVRHRRHIAADHCASPADPYGSTFWQARANTPGSDAVFQFSLNQPGLYKTSLWWPRVPGANRETQVHVEVQKAGGPAMANAVFDQRRASRRWIDVGPPFTFTVPSSGAQVKVVVRRSSRTDRWVVADGVRVLRVG
jgi:hypothetical protein